MTLHFERAGGPSHHIECSVGHGTINLERPLMQAHGVAVSLLCGVGGKSTREHRTRVRSQRSERLQFPALGSRAS
jgi:hypothetical protein